MKIGFICDQKTCLSGASNGIRMQALIWRDALLSRGHDVILINSWGDYDWSSFDIVHCFSFADSISFVKELKFRGIKIVLSPIIDTIQNKMVYSMASRWGSEKLRLYSPGFNLRSKKENIDLFLARSSFEAEYICDCFGVPVNKISIVPLSFRGEFQKDEFFEKENFCLHVSSITQPRKNVLRLLQAAEKYKFNLILAGSNGPSEAFKPFKEIIDRNNNIQYLGFVSDERLNDLYNRAKVFALPSINEGVGLVALEAAMHGCDIVVTKYGGPKEYYPDGLAQIVDPYSIDDIGNSILKALKNTCQPMLRDYIFDHFNKDVCITNLISLYNSLFNN